MIRFVKITDIKSNIIGERDVITKKLNELGNLSRDEKIVAIIFIITVIAWIKLIRNMFLPTMGDSTIAIASAISLFLVPSICSKYANRKGFTEDDNNTKISLNKQLQQ